MNDSWKKEEIGSLKGMPRITLHKLLDLTSCEISINTMEAGKAQSFSHKHKQNEEIYIVISGRGEFMLDTGIFPVREGSCIRIDPDVTRTIRADQNEALTFICIQAAKNSLQQFTKDDGIIFQEKPVW